MTKLEKGRSGHEVPLREGNDLYLSVGLIQSGPLRQAMQHNIIIRRWKTGLHHHVSSVAIHCLVLRKSLLLMNACLPSILA